MICTPKNTIKNNSYFYSECLISYAQCSECYSFIHMQLKRERFCTAATSWSMIIGSLSSSTQISCVRSPPLLLVMTAWSTRSSRCHVSAKIAFTDMLNQSNFANKFLLYQNSEARGTSVAHDVLTPSIAILELTPKRLVNASGTCLFLVIFFG